jgi:hypothetical protein
MTEEVAETPINTIETEPTPEVVVETPVAEVTAEKPKRKGRKPKEEVAALPQETPTAKRKITKKKAEKVEVIPVEAAEEPQAPVATYEPEPLQEVENYEPTFKEVQKSMTELQAEFRRLRREQKTTHYKKMLEGKI